MPKMKTKSAAAKRFRVTGSGKIVRRCANKRHILTKKTSKRKRNLKHARIVTKADEKLISPMLPYKKYL